jgi:hypothetical protein
MLKGFSRRGLVIYGAILAAIPVLLVQGLPLAIRGLGYIFVKERVTIGELSPAQERINRARYRFAMPYCAGKRVADIAAGEGYGTQMLRQVAASVDPYDKFPSGDNIIIDLEKERWGKRYDVIVSLETIEHLANPEFFLRNVAETSDLAIISTPMNEDPNENPHHKQVWTPARFRSVAEQFFTCEYYGQDGENFPRDDNPPRQMMAVCKPK